MQVLDLYNRTAQLNSQKKWLTGELAKLISKITAAQQWNKQQPAIASFLEQLQVIMQERSIGQFAKLLTAINKDVLSNEKEISLESYMSHGLPALKIETISNGFNESIMEGSGAAMANVISAGLRFIALSRLKTRQFIILDEPDCWISPDRVPLFAKVIGEVAKTLNIQTIIISHHKHDYFKQYGRVIRLTKKNGVLETELVSDVEGKENPQAIKKIILKNFMSHQYTEYELHPQVTCIIGDNDIGKSVLLSAVKAVAYGDSSDSFIRHGENDAQVQILFDDKIIYWQRFLKINPREHPQKVLYSMYQSAKDGLKQLHKEYSSNEAPNWINDELNIKTTNNIDVQIGNQKEPVFLLGGGTKAQDRAKILSLGQESTFIQKMMERLKEKTKENKQIIKDGEIRGKATKRALEVLDDIENIFLNAEKLLNEEKGINDKQIKIDKLKSFLTDYQKTQKITEINKIKYQIDKVKIKPVGKIKDLIEGINSTTKISSITKIKEDFKRPAIKDTEKIKRTIYDYRKILKTSSLKPVEYVLMVPKIKETKKISILGEDIYNTIQDINVNKNRINKIEAEQTKIRNQLNSLIKENNNLCPTCKQLIKLEHFIK